MTPEKIDYVAILNDMKAKRAMLDASIAALEAALVSGTLGQAVEGLTSGIASGGGGSSNAQGVPMDLPKGAFLGKNMTDAVLLYLSAVRQRKTVKDIAAALVEGGIVSTSDKFAGVVQAKMQQLGARGQVLKFADGWGLAEWYPAGFRSTADKAAKPLKKAKKRKVASKAANLKEKVQRDPNPEPKKATEKSGAQAKIESFFATNIGEFANRDIAKELGLSTGAVNLVCAKLAHQGKIEKTPTGRYKPKIHAMPKAV
jgi:hypothetical protein